MVTVEGSHRLKLTRSNDPVMNVYPSLKGDEEVLKFSLMMKVNHRPQR